ncbi:High-affinity branched-chain amino acid transport ATP-binding protein LivF [bioreactor metagenome]|uniref:High-affinity branched-chain amino acid transport ATP-binding protein LivF n=1 Tax=bioreactor metagenome TaxID=1076179 RepID=A0A645BIA3_9ZZZZ
MDEGEIVALIGPNGAGKTTAMHAISGLLRRSPGSIFFQGADISTTEAHKLVKLGISQEPEGRGIFPNLTVLENLNLGTYLRNDKEQIRWDREWVMDNFPRLRERAGQIAGTLSGGELQMLSIARALMARPKLLLMDEPSMGLAPIVVEEIFRTITRLNRENKTTILLVEQNALMALTVSSRAYVLEVGTIATEGRSEDMKRDESIQKAYLGI